MHRPFKSHHISPNQDYAEDRGAFISVSSVPSEFLTFVHTSVCSFIQNIFIELHGAFRAGLGGGQGSLVSSLRILFAGRLMHSFL